MYRFFLTIVFFTLNASLLALSTTTPTTISFTGNNASPQVAVADNGNAIAVWLNFPNNIQTAFFNHFPGSWSPFGTLAQGSVPQVAIDGVGNAIIVWVSGNNQIIATRFNVSTIAYSPLVQLSVPGTINIAPKISMNSLGTAVVVWIQNTPFQILASTFNPLSMTWSPAATFANNIYPASFTLDNFGTGIAIFDNLPSGFIQAFSIITP